MKRGRRVIVQRTVRIEQLGNGAVEVEMLDTRYRPIVLYFQGGVSRRQFRHMIGLTEKVWGGND